MGRTLRDEENTKERENASLIEAILFVAARFLSIQDLITYSALSSIEVNEALETLSKKYRDEDSALELISRNNLWKMDVKQKYHFIVNKLATGSVEFTKAEQETLAIIAYKQPIKQSVVIKIRGNKAYDHVHKFIDLNLIKSKKEGHTNILTLSEEFYDYFNVSKKSNSEVGNFLKQKELGDEE